LFTFLYQVLLISIGLLAPLSAIGLFTWPFIMACMVMMKRDFRKWAGLLVLSGLAYPLLVVLGQWVGS